MNSIIVHLLSNFLVVPLTCKSGSSVSLACSFRMLIITFTFSPTFRTPLTASLAVLLANTSSQAATMSSLASMIGSSWLSFRYVTRSAIAPITLSVAFSAVL